VYSGLCTLHARIVYNSIRGASVAAVDTDANGKATSNLHSSRISPFDVGIYMERTIMEKAASTKAD
jgi:hypothetical protein